MMLKILTSGYFIVLTGVMAVFCGMIAYLPLETVIIILNGIFFGGLVSIILIYGDVIIRAIRGDLPDYGADFRQMVVSMLGFWLAIGLFIGTSIYLYSTDGSHNVMLVSAIARLIAIVSAAGQITAPNLGHPIYYGRDRKLLWVSMGTGLMASFVIIALQATAAFAWPL